MNDRLKNVCEYLRPGRLLLASLSLLVSTSAGLCAASGNFEQEWSKLIEAAKEEGTLSVASGGAPSRQYRPIMAAFTKKFGVNVEVATGNATTTLNRVLAERKAGKYTVDVALISSRENNQRLVPSESLVPFAPLLIHPEVLDKSGWYLGRHWYADKFSKFTFIYHAWWVPALGWKQDAIPGFINEAWTNIEQVGVYRGQCAELCGKDHGFMPIVVKVLPKAEYQAWLAQQKAANAPVEAAPAPAEAAPAEAAPTDEAAPAAEPVAVATN